MNNNSIISSPFGGVVGAWFFLSLLLVACSEVEEASRYDNWQERNIAFADSLQNLAGMNVVATAEQADAMTLGEMYAIQTTASTSAGAQYVYCKKLVGNTTGERPVYTGHHSTVNAYYYGTYITGDEFDGNFDGYSSRYIAIALPPAKVPTAFDSYATFSVSGVIAGWTAALQYMRMGERWLIYVPYQSAYGDDDYSNGTSTIPAYSLLTFDIVLDSFAD